MRGVFRINSKRGALTAIKIVKHYGGESLLYKVEEVKGLWFYGGARARRLKTLFSRAGKKSRGLTVRPHGLRKMLYNELKNVGTPLDVRNMIVGKRVSEDIATYVNDDGLKKWFLLVLPRISISEPKPETTKELRERIGKLEEIAIKQQEQVEELTSMLQLLYDNPELAKKLKESSNRADG